MENCIVTQSRLLIKQWSFGFIESSPLTRSMKNYFGFIHASSFPLQEGQLFYWSIMTAVDSIKCRCTKSRHDMPSGRFSKSRGLSASVSFLSSPPPSRSFTCTIFHAVFDFRPSFFAPKPHGNACYTGYWWGNTEWWWLCFLGVWTHITRDIQGFRNYAQMGNHMIRLWAHNLHNSEKYTYNGA